MTATSTQLEPPEVIEFTTFTTESEAPIAPLPADSHSGAGNSGKDFGTYLKLMSCGFAFFVAGINDGSIGALIPYVIRQHDLTTAIVSGV